MEDTVFAGWLAETSTFDLWVKDQNDTAGGCEFCGNTKTVGVNEFGDRYCAGCYAEFMGSVDEMIEGWAR